MADELIVRIGAKATEFSAELKRLKKQTATFEKGLATTAKISAAAFAGLAASVGLAVAKFTSFEKGFTNVQTLLDKSSFSTKTLSKGIKDLQSDVLKLGAESGESFDNLNQGLFDLISAGVPAEEATKALADAVNLATAGATDTATSVKALTAALSAYGSEAGTTEEIAQKFFTAQKFGITTVGELAGEFNKIAGTSKELGVGFNEALAAATTLTNNGAKPTAQAFTELRAVLNAVIPAQDRLKNQSEAVQNALSLQNIEQKGIVEALRELKVATGGNVVTLQKLLGSTEAVGAALALTGSQASKYDNILAQMNDEQQRAINFNDALATKQATTSKAIDRAKRSLEAITIQLGERFAPLINDVADALSAMAQSFNNLTDEQKDSIATFIKWGTIITGAVATVSTFGIVLIKAARLLKTLSTVFKVGRLAAIGFTGALTGGLSIVIGFLPEIIQGFQFLFGLLGKSEAKSLDKVNKQLDEMEQRRKRIADQGGRDPLTGQTTENLDKRISKLKEERTELEKLNNEKAKTVPGAKPGEVGGPAGPPAPPAAKKDPTVEATKKNEKEKTKIKTDESKKRIQTVKNENALLVAEAEGATDEELSVLQRRQELKAEQADAELEKDAELREAKLENIRLQNEQLTAEEEEAFLLKQEQKATQNEEEALVDEELQATLQERRDARNQKELADIRAQQLTKAQAKQKNEVEKEKKQVESNNREALLADKHGKVIAKLDKVVNNDQVTNVKNTADQLAQLQNSKNKRLKAIGKRAAQVQIAIDTARGAVAAYTSLAGIPIVGPILGALAAGALIAYGAERIADVNKAQRGGVVPTGAGGSRDRVQTFLEPGELVVPKAIAPDFIQTAGRPDTQAVDGDERVGSIVDINIEDEAADFITAKQRENTDLAIGIAS